MSRGSEKRGARSQHAPWVVLAPESIAAVAHVLLQAQRGEIDVARIGPDVVVLPILDELTLVQAMRVTGRCKTAVCDFMRANPAAVVRGADGIRRVRLNWLRAWVAGKERLAALQRAAAMEVAS